MMNTFSWKKKLFSNTYGIYSEGKLIGKLTKKSFSQSADGVINEEKFSFRTKGFFKKTTTIISKKDKEVIGRITYNNWMTKASIQIDDERSRWKYDNFWNTKWSISDSDGMQLKYTGSTSSGSISSNTDNALLLLSGLYVTNYYSQATVAVMIAVFIPIWMTLFN